MRDNLITQSNDLLNASYSLTLNERRLLLACISQIDGRKEFNSTTPIFLGVDEAHCLFFDEQTAKDTFKQLIQAAKQLQARLVTLFWEDNIKELNTYFVQTMRIDYKKREVQLYFSVGILPYLTELKNNFTSYKLMNISRLTSVHAMRVYELIVKWSCQTSSTHYKEIELIDFKILLGIENKYSTISGLKRSVIEPCIKQINESTDFKLDIKLKKYTSSFDHIQFFYNKRHEPTQANLTQRQEIAQIQANEKYASLVKKQEPPLKNQKDENTPDMFNGLTDKQIAKFSVLLANYPSMSKYSDHNDRSYDDFARRLAIQLKEHKYVEKYMPYLVELGFKKNGL